MLVIILQVYQVGDNTPIVNETNINKIWPVVIIIVIIGLVFIIPLNHSISFISDIPIYVLNQINSIFYSSSIEWTNVNIEWSGTTPIINQISPINQVQILGITLYTYGALWLFIVSILLILSMLVPLALAFTVL